MTDIVMTQSQSLQDWLSYLERIHPQTIELGLSRVRSVAERCDLLQPDSFVITIGGTNGKGTTCAMLASILKVAGYRVGVYASPHILHYNERIVFDGSPVSDQEICDAFARIETSRQETSLTFFEFGTLAALETFKTKNADFILLEVGLGGRLDATNIIDSDIAAITTIDLDHCDWLGDTKELIATEKSGIYRAGKPAISGELQPPITLKAGADSINANWYSVNEHFQYGESGSSWWYSGQTLKFDTLLKPSLPLQNAATALAIVEHIQQNGYSISNDSIQIGLQQATLNGRMQVLSSSPMVVVDVAHNPHSARYLAAQLSNIAKDKNIIAVVGMLKDKDIEHTLDAVKPLIDQWYLADLVGPRAATATQLAAYLSMDSGVSQYPSVKDAYMDAIKKHSSPDDFIIVFGSFLTVAAVSEIFE